MTAANAVVDAPFIFLVRALDVQVGSTQGEVSLSHGARAADFVCHVRESVKFHANE